MGYSASCVPCVRRSDKLDGGAKLCCDPQSVYQRMVLIWLSTLKNEDMFTVSGLFGYTPLIIQGTVRTSIAFNGKPSSTSQLIVALECEVRQHAGSIKSEILLYKEAVAWRAKNKSQALGAVSRPYKIVIKPEEARVLPSSMCSRALEVRYTLLAFAKGNDTQTSRPLFLVRYEPDIPRLRIGGGVTWTGSKGGIHYRFTLDKATYGPQDHLVAHVHLSNGGGLVQDGSDDSQEARPVSASSNRSRNGSSNNGGSVRRVQFTLARTTMFYANKGLLNGLRKMGKKSNKLEEEEVDGGPSQTDTILTHELSSIDFDEDGNFRGVLMVDMPVRGHLHQYTLCETFERPGNFGIRFFASFKIIPKGLTKSAIQTERKEVRVVGVSADDFEIRTRDAEKQYQLELESAVPYEDEFGEYTIEGVEENGEFDYVTSGDATVDEANQNIRSRRDDAGMRTFNAMEQRTVVLGHTDLGVMDRPGIGQAVSATTGKATKPPKPSSRDGRSSKAVSDFEAQTNGGGESTQVNGNGVSSQTPPPAPRRIPVNPPRYMDDGTTRPQSAGHIHEDARQHIDRMDLDTYLTHGDAANVEGDHDLPSYQESGAIRPRRNGNHHTESEQGR